ncbi:MAG: zinc metallopeptidase [Chitinophagaceae bacterium]|nr:zinc metallopeptidase [Chitinophagaceae bacterium]
MTPGILIVSLLFMGIGFLIQMRLKSKFKQYAQHPLLSGLTGRQVAEKMLKENGIFDVQVVSVDGFLSDHYNPMNKTVNLSPDVFNGNSIASAAVAAHECGHAVQHATAYQWLMLRSRLVPIAQISTTLSQWILAIGVGIFTVGGGNQTVLLIGILLFAASTLFTTITLPVEFDASNRALAWLNHTNVVNGQEHDGAKDALKWAAMTYVVAALASIATLVQYILIYMARSRD